MKRKYKFLTWFILLLSVILTIRIALFLNWTPTSFPLDLKWQTDLGNSTYERPAYRDGLIYLPASNIAFSYWYGIKAATGQKVWSQRVKRNSYLRCLTSDFLIISGLNSFLALNPHDGKVIWKGSSAFVADCNDEMVFYSYAERDTIHAVDIHTGEKLWEETNPYKSFYGLVYNAEADEIIAKDIDFHIVDPESGDLLRTFEKVTYAPIEKGRGPMYVIDQGQLFVGGTVQDARTGQVIHKEEHYDGILPSTVTTDTIYISTSRTRGVVALDRKTFEVKWIYKPPQWLPHRFISPVEILDGIGYVISTDMSLRAFDLETGQELGYWQPGWFDLVRRSLYTPVTGFIVGRPDRCGLSVSEDTLFVSFGDGKLYAFGK